MSVTALVPYYGGPSPARTGSSDPAKRPDYLRRTLESLKGFAGLIVLGACAPGPGLPSEEVFATEAIRWITFDCEPQYLPANLLRWAQKRLATGLVYFTEADQVLHIDPELLNWVQDGTYLVPHRLEQLGPRGEGSHRGLNVSVDGTLYVLPNGYPERDAGLYHPPDRISGFGAAFIATTALLRKVTFTDDLDWPLEHAGGFDIYGTGRALKTGNWREFWVEHLSGYEYNARGCV